MTSRTRETSGLLLSAMLNAMILTGPETAQADDLASQQVNGLHVIQEIVYVITFLKMGPKLTKN